MGLWRGSTTAALEEERLAALEERIDTDLALGRHVELAADLAALVAAHPLRERLRGQLMLALYRSGRQVEALQAFRDARQMLVDELGIEPSDELRRLQAQILTGDSALAAPETARGTAFHYLPRDIADFTGRHAELDRLLAVLPGVAGATTAIVIKAIDGMAGIGKTVLAVRAAHQVADSYPDAQLFIDLRAHTAGQDPIDPADALDTLLRAVGVSSERIPHELPERAALWRAELAHRKALVVLDNAASAAQVRPLLPGNVVHSGGGSRSCHQRARCRSGRGAAVRLSATGHSDRRGTTPQLSDVDSRRSVQTLV